MKDSIKREQSQAGLSFAERKNRRSLAGGESNFRPKVKRNRLFLLLALLLTAATGAWAQEQWDVVWDFTAWSAETVTALKADAAASKTEGWSDVEKEADAAAGADPTEAAKDNCFWFDGTVNEDGSLSANGAVIKELKGLKFNSDYAAKRSLAIAVNYPSTSLGDYAGGAYLWLGGSNQTCFTIPGVKAGSKITIEVESHKTSSARGIGLYKNSYAAENLIGEQFTPKTFEAKTWEIAEDCNVVVCNTNSCHIYTIKVKAPAAAPAEGYTVSMKSGVKDADKWTVKVGEGQAQALPIGGLKGDGSETVTLQYNGRLKVKGVKATSDAAPAAVPVTAITLNKTETSIMVGATETLSVTSVLPEEATDKTYTWKTSDVSKATVDQDGKVTAVAEGTVTIYAEANDGSGVKGNCAVTVTPATITVTINQSDWGDWDTPITKDGVTVSAGMIVPMDGNLMSGGTFSTTLGNFTKIVVTASHCNASGTGWSGNHSSMTWTGTPASTVSFSGEFMGMGMGQTTIVCTIVPTN